MKKSLQGIKIIDLSRVLAGPVCTQILGDLGAEIIKIEKPFAGDDTRHWGPPYLQDKDNNDTSESAYYLSANRNKRSLAVDISKKEGQNIIHELLAQSDVMIQNFKTGGLEKYGLDYDQIKEKHPHIIYCSITGFGLNGPLANEPGYDFLAQAMGGLMACTGSAETEPMKVGVALSDVITGLYAAIGILSALHTRQNSLDGQGQLIDLSLLDCTLASLTNIAQYYLSSQECSPRLGNAHATIVPYQAFKASDGFIILAIGNDLQFARFCKFIEKEEWSESKEYATNQMRVKNRDVLVPLLEAIIKCQSCEYWIGHLKEVNVPCGPVNTMDKVFDMEQIQARDMQITMQHGLTKENISLVGSPLNLSKTPVEYTDPPPYLGQHTQEILENTLQLNEEQIRQLEEKNVIQR